MNVTDDDLQRAIEESMRAENRRREQSFSTPGLNDSVDDALMAKALEESLAWKVIEWEQLRQVMKKINF